MSRLGKYELGEQLGRGGYGTVYRALDSALEVERAVKVLHPALVADPDFIERFRREAKIAARLKHPNIVPVYDLDQAEGRYFLVMEYLPGGSLKDVMAIEGRLAFERALAIASQIAAALDYAHSRDLVHRDVKPGNILFEADGTAKLSDFGFAKALGRAESTTYSSLGALIGTPPYMAPELWLKAGASPASDQYSLACIFYEMIAGQQLFAGENTPIIMKRHFDPLVLPEEWPARVPPGVREVLRRALAMEPDQRYPSASDFAAALQQLVEVEPAPVEPELPPEPAGERTEETLAIKDPVPAAEEVKPIEPASAGETGVESAPIAAEETAQPDYIPPPTPPPPLPEYAGRLFASPLETEIPEEQKRNGNWLWLSCGCLSVLLCLLIVGFYAFDRLNLYCTPYFSDITNLVGGPFGISCP